MKRTLTCLILLTAVGGFSGCAICCTPYDYAYSAYGGKWQRQDMYNGRVGSAFSPAGHVMETTVEEVPLPGQVMRPVSQ